MLFGTSGIRDLYGKVVNEKLALRIANLFADCDVVIARDTRTTGESLANATIAGVLSAGKNAIYLGIMPTPALALLTARYKCRGIMITASHNQPEYNGLKFYENGHEISRAQEKGLEERYNQNECKLVEWDKVGNLKTDQSALEDHKNLIKKLVDCELIKKKRPKVVVDSNGAAAVLTPQLLTAIGCDVTSINDQLCGFARDSEPNAQNLKGLAAKVVELGADLGIGHDGDGDRAVVVDEKGEVLALDVQLAIMIDCELERSASNNKKKNVRIVSTVEASLCVRETVEKAGAELIVTPVGSSYVSELLEKKDAIFGGEPCGEYIFADGLHVPDGVLTAAKFVEIFCKKGRLSELEKKYKTYHIVREKFKCENSKKYEIVERIKKAIPKTKDARLETGNWKLRTDDGIRVDEEDGWFLIRASGTEACIRLTAEYKNLEILNKNMQELRELIICTL